MAESMDRTPGGNKPVPSAEPRKSVEEMWKDLFTLAASIKEKIANLAKPENALDLPQIKAAISTLFLNAASTCIALINLSRENKATEEKLKELSGKPDVISWLDSHMSSCLQNAKKYGSSIKSGTPKTTLDDIKGQEDVKEVVRSFVFLAKHPSLFETYKIQGGLGLMMYGAPGTGKTMFAEAIANAMQLPLFVITPADLFKSYVGASEQAVRQIFDDIGAFSDGAILFVDECESIFSRRDKDTKDYKSAVTSELLQRMNGQGVDGSRRIMVAATNCPWDIDPAYLRYKRFSHMVHIMPPDTEAISAIIHSKLKGVPCEDGLADFIIDCLDKKVHGAGEGERFYCSAADICGIVENACRMAVEQMVKEDRGGDDLSVVKVSKEMVRKALMNFKPVITESYMQRYINFKPGDDQ